MASIVYAAKRTALDDPNVVKWKMFEACPRCSCDVCARVPKLDEFYCAKCHLIRRPGWAARRARDES